MENSSSERGQRSRRLETIRKRQDFLIAQAGLRAPTPAFLILRGEKPNPAGAPRVGFTVTKKIGKAVLRNRIRRRLRAAAQATFSGAAGSFDYVIVARPSAATREFPLMLDDMKRALLRLNALPK